MNMEQPNNNGKNPLQELLDQLKQEDSVIRVQLNDQRLCRLAEYDATKGFTNMQVDPMLLQEKFQELKALVKRGSFTLKTLEDDVYSRWGIPEIGRDEVLRKEAENGLKPNRIKGFNIGDIEIADIPEDSPQNT